MSTQDMMEEEEKRSSRIENDFGPQKSQADGNASFLRAARAGNLDKVLEYLKGSTDINTSNANGLNALHLAAKEGHVNIVTELLSRGANVDAATKKGNTALHIASLAGQEEIVKILVQKNAKVNVQSQNGFTPLYMAAQENHSEVVQFLLHSGASQGLATEDGFTPLAVALQQGHDQVVKVLLENDSRGKVKLPALHMAAKKDDVKAAALLLQNEQNVDQQSKMGGLVNDTTKSGFTPLHICSHYGNTNVARLLIEKNADLNFKARNGIAPLHVGSKWGRTHMVQLLLDSGATIGLKTRDGLTPLHCGARSGHETVVDTLLERGAPHAAKTKNGLTALHMAAQGDHVDCARLLLYHKASIDDVTIDYLTALHIAAHCGNVKTAKLLLDRKCDPNARALNGFTPLHIACKKNRIKVVELLLKCGATIEATTESGLTPLHVSAFMGHMNIVVFLLQHGASPDQPTMRGETPLHLAARANQTDIIRILLRNGAHVDAKAREQQTALHIAARLGNVDIVVLLLQHGAFPDSATKDQYTALHIAAKEGQEEVASVLLEHGASLNLPTKKGFTPLHVAAKYGNIKVTRLLLQREANPDIQGKNGLTPLHVAAHYNNVNVALLLLDNGASPQAAAKNGYTPLHIAAKKNQMDIATTLLEYGAKPNAESKSGFTPLHLAAQDGHLDMVSLLLEHSASVTCKAHNGLTPMHLSAQEDKVNVAEILVKYSAQIDTSTKAGYTPLHTACHFGQVNMIRFLLEHGASVTATTKLGYTPLHQAAQQGHVLVISLLLKYQASPNAVSNNGQTPLSIAKRLGYISAVDVLQPVTTVTDTPATVQMTDEKYKVQAPETMQETMLTDSDDEGEGDTILGDQSYNYVSYMTTENMKGFEDDSIKPVKGLSRARDEYRSIRVSEYSEDYFNQSSAPNTNNRRSGHDDSFGFDSHDAYAPGVEGTENSLHVAADVHVPLEEIIEADVTRRTFAGRPPSAGRDYYDYTESAFPTSLQPDNVAVDHTPAYMGKLKWKSFLVSFMVDARGGAMRGCRHSGVRVIIPPGKCAAPTRVTCRLIKKDKMMKPPPLLEGEALASRVLEMGPNGSQFLGPVIIEIPHFASLRGKEREITILRSDDGENWYEHNIIATDELVHDALNGSFEELESAEDLFHKRITRIVTTDFPQYFAMVTRIRQENNTIGAQGGMLSSSVIPHVQAVFPEGALQKNIRVGLQVQPVSPELIAKMLGNRVAVSPIVTVEPRRRKFHKPITLTIPVPQATQKGMINQYGGDAPTLRLLCSITGGPAPAQWEDITGTTPLTFVNDCVSFTTSVSARFWLMDCQNINEAAKMATEVYRETISVPFMSKFVVFAKRHEIQEGRLRCFVMTDDKMDKTLESQEQFVEVARSRDVEVLDGRPQYIEMAGNLVPITKSDEQLHINFNAFQENRLPFTARVRDSNQEAIGRVAFMRDPKTSRHDTPQSPICNLNITLPEEIKPEIKPEIESSLELRKKTIFMKHHGLYIPDTISKADLNLSDISNNLQEDWIPLAEQLDISPADVERIKVENNAPNYQALAMLQFWLKTKPHKATGNELERALRKVGREDIILKCIHNVETVTDELEKAVAKDQLDESDSNTGFVAFKNEIGSTSRDASMNRGLSLDVSYDEHDVLKENESAPESESEASTVIEREPILEAAPVQIPDSIEEELLIPTLDDRRPIAHISSPEEEQEISDKKRDAYIDLLSQLDTAYDSRETLEQTYSEETEAEPLIEEESLTQVERSPPQEDIAVKIDQIPIESMPKSSSESSKSSLTEDKDVDQEKDLASDDGLISPPSTPAEGVQEKPEPEAREVAERLEEAERALSENAQDSSSAEEDVTDEIQKDENVTGTEDYYRERFGDVDYVKGEGGYEEREEYGDEEKDEMTTRVHMKKQIHKKVIYQDGKEETVVTETTQVDQDNEGPDELQDSLKDVVSKFMD